MGGFIDRLTAVLRGTPAEDTETAEEGEETDLLSSHEEQLLEHLQTAHETIAWQQDLQDQIGWSSSKTSRILTQLEADERIIRYRIGRQKLVSLPDTDPELVRKYFAEYMDSTGTGVPIEGQ